MQRGIRIDGNARRVLEGLSKPVGLELDRQHVAAVALLQGSHDVKVGLDHAGAPTVY